MKRTSVTEALGQERRHFLTRLLQGALGVGLLGLLGAVVAYIFPPERREFNPGRQRVRVGRVDDFALGKARQVLFNGRPVWVLRLKSGFIALSAICTHQGCIVDWDEKRSLLACPCHAGLFDVNGSVISGPPRWPLPRLRVEVINGEIFLGADASAS